METPRLIAALDALGEPNRLAVVLLLRGSGALTAGQILERLTADRSIELGKSGLSAHFRVLVQAGILSAEKAGRHVRYALRRDRLEELVEEMRTRIC